MSDTDSLQYLPMERWGELEEAFKTDWPRGISGYTALRTQRDLVSRGLGYGFKVYCPFGDVSSGMVALNKKDTLNEIIIHSPRLDTTQLEKALVSTKIIDWSTPILVPCLPPHTHECVKKVAQKLNLNFEGDDEHTPHDLVLYDVHKPAFDVRLPDDVTFQLLTEDLVDAIDAVWPNRYDSSKWVFKLLIKNKTGYGLFKNKELLAWVFINEIGALVHLYTHDDHRNKGYGKTVMKLLCNKSLEEKKPVFGYCMRGNVSAEKLYESLGFEKFYHVNWTMLTPK
ncbi:uncharacterized protein LOC114362040 isoform X1 [Ostrinia furnacalis]|uniref:uncharacterized protein LOC114362040 isoform X1 n=1 Tax=Ostrinia furnacalis TaxID=93504 RepID=UPI00103933A5|nr:uncharacterized protein LOC114362040 isoform X1 [Ostrinia furnacalis]